MYIYIYIYIYILTFIRCIIVPLCSFILLLIPHQIREAYLNKNCFVCFNFVLRINSCTSLFTLHFIDHNYEPIRNIFVSNYFVGDKKVPTTIKQFIYSM